MALALNNYVTVPSIAVTNPVGIYTAPAGYNAIVLCAQASSTSDNSQDVTLAHKREIVGIAVTTYSSYKKPISSLSSSVFSEAFFSISVSFCMS